MPPEKQPGSCPYPHSKETGCPVPHQQAAWDERAREQAVEAARQAAHASGIEAERAADMATRAAENRARHRQLGEINESFVNALRKKLGYGHPLSERTGQLAFTWTPEAEARLAEVPEFCRELTRWRVEWTAHKLGLGTTITPEVMQVKYDMWGEVSHRIRERGGGGSLPWTDGARARFDRIPEFVKGQVLEAVEGNARSLGATAVDEETVDRVIAKWADTGDFHEGLYGFR